MKFKFLIYSDFYNERFGGHRILHKLGNTLHSLNEEVYSLCEPSEFVKYPKMNISDFNPEDTIVIYPEVVIGNPINAKYVTRWLLNDQKYEYGENDLVFKLFSSGLSKKYAEHLLIFDYENDRGFWSEDNSKKDINFFMMRKTVIRKDNPKDYVNANHQKIIDLGVYDYPSLSFDDYVKDKSFEEIRSALRRTKYFISFDILSFWNTIASMCGAISVVIPSTIKSSSEFYSDHIYKYGVSYGFDDIPKRHPERYKLHDYFCHLEENNRHMADNFVNYCYRHFDKEST